jgi:hypothetical protein
MEDNPEVWPNIFFILYFGQLRIFHYRLGVARPFLMLEAFFLTLP